VGGIIQESWAALSRYRRAASSESALLDDTINMLLGQLGASYAGIWVMTA